MSEPLLILAHLWKVTLIKRRLAPRLETINYMVEKLIMSDLVLFAFILIIVGAMNAFGIELSDKGDHVLSSLFTITILLIPILLIALIWTN